MSVSTDAKSIEKMFGLWRGREAVLIGGSPELESFNWDVLEFHLTLGLNAAYIVGSPIVDAVMIKDRRLINNIETIDIPMIYIKRGPTDDLGWDNSFGLIERREWSESLADGVYVGDTTAVSALNFLQIIGVSRIILIGFSGKTKGHWHHEYPLDWEADDYEKQRDEIRGFLRPQDYILTVEQAEEYLSYHATF